MCLFAGESAALVGVDDEGNHAAGLSVPECAMVGDAAIAEHAGEHGQCGDRQRLIDKRFLGVDRRRGAAARQGVFFLIQHLRKQLGHDAQPVFTPAVARVQGLTEDELAAGAVVAQVQVIAGVGSGTGYSCRDLPARRARVHAPHNDVEAVVAPASCGEALSCEMVRDGGPIQAPKQVEPRHKNGGLVVAYVGDRERLANAVGFRNRVSIHDRDLEALRMAPRCERLVEVGEVE